MIDLKKEFPKLMAKIDDEDIDELRYLIDLNENYEDIDDEENDIFDPEDYNYIVYIKPRVMEAIGEELAQNLHLKLADSKMFEDFIASEDDLYGIKSDLDEDGLAIAILKYIEEQLEA